MRRSIVLPLLFTACMLGSCTSNLYYDTTMPPEVQVNPEQWKVAVVKQFDPSNLDINRQGKVRAIAEGSYHAYEGMLHAVEADESFVLVHEDSLFRQVAGPLQPQDVQAIHRQTPHHLLLVLENFDVNFDKEIERIEDENQQVEKTAYYTLQATATWAMYDSTGHLIDRSTITRNQPYDSRAVISGLLAIGPSYANAVESVNHLSHQIGGDYWSRLYPRSGTFTRTLYTNSALAQAVFLMHQRRMDDAIAQLQPLIVSENQGLSGKAAHNMAVAYELKGDLEEAQKWAVYAEARGAKLANQLLMMYQWSSSRK